MAPLICSLLPRQIFKQKNKYNSSWSFTALICLLVTNHFNYFVCNTYLFVSGEYLNPLLFVRNCPYHQENETLCLTLTLHGFLPPRSWRKIINFNCICILKSWNIIPTLPNFQRQIKSKIVWPGTLEWGGSEVDSPGLNTSKCWHLNKTELCRLKRKDQKAQIQRINEYSMVIKTVNNSHEELVELNLHTTFNLKNKQNIWYCSFQTLSHTQSWTLMSQRKTSEVIPSLCLDRISRWKHRKRKTQSV